MGLWKKYNWVCKIHRGHRRNTNGFFSFGVKILKIIIKLLNLNLSGGESGEKKEASLESVSFFPLSLGLLSFLKS